MQQQHVQSLSAGSMADDHQGTQEMCSCDCCLLLKWEAMYTVQ